MSDVEFTRPSDPYDAYEVHDVDGTRDPYGAHDAADGYDLADVGDLSPASHAPSSAGNAAVVHAPPAPGPRAGGPTVLRAGPEYDGEFVSQSFRGGQARTERLDADGMQQAELHIDEHGLARDGAGALLDSSGVSAFGGNRPASEALFARSAVDGKLRTRNPQVVRGAGLPAITHHTTLTDGAGALSAGTAQFDEGHLTHLTDQSGHFRPPAETIHDEVQRLKADGLSTIDDRPVDDPAMRAEATRLESELAATGDAARKAELVGQLRAIHRHLEHRNTPTKVSLQSKAGLSRPADARPDEVRAAFDGTRTLTEEQFSQTGGNEQQIRAKDLLLQELRRTVARTDGVVPSGGSRDAVVQRRADEDAPRAGAGRDASGLPEQIKAAVENVSGLSMDGVKVHYDSARPSQLNAHAYTQGSDIHIGPGQEQHLPHEAWHVVQQAQGRVKPTMQLGGSTVNDDGSLEQEADTMGARVMQAKASNPAGMEWAPGAD